MAKPVIVIGDVNADMLFREVHEPGRLTYDFAVRGGGTAANTAVALAHLGLPTEFVSAVGDDGYGRFLREDLVAEGVGATHVRVKAGKSSLLIVYILNEDGDALYCEPGWPLNVNDLATGPQPAEIDMALIAGAQWLHVSGVCFIVPSFREGTLRAMERAREAGVPISLDLNYRFMGQPETFWELVHKALELSDVVLGSATDDWPMLVPEVPFEEAARQVSAGKRICVARMGADGSMAIAPEGEARVDAFPVQIIDAVGAGDTYNAGFIAAQLAGLSLLESLRMGSAVAAITLSRVGTRSSPTRVEVDALLAGDSSGAVGQ